MTRTISPLLAALLALALVSPLASAQTAPNANRVSKSLGGDPKATGKLMSKAELKACMKRQDDLQAQRTALEADQAAISRDRTAVEQAAQNLVTERDALMKRSEAIQALNAKYAAQNAKIEDFNNRSKQFADAKRTGPTANAQAIELNREKDVLDKAGVALDAERATLAAESDALPDAVKQLNERAVSQASDAQAWNARNTEIRAKLEAQEDARRDWQLTCGNRRYFEDDEAAIRAGK